MHTATKLTSSLLSDITRRKQLDRLSGFSNYGAQAVHLAAPGEAIMSTVPGGGTENMSGTSMAGPFVAGAAALLQATSNSRLTVAKLKQLLLDSVDKLSVLDGKVSTGVSAAWPLLCLLSALM